MLVNGRLFFFIISISLKDFFDSFGDLFPSPFNACLLLYVTLLSFFPLV